jgi:hypothetical protein
MIMFNMTKLKKNLVMLNIPILEREQNKQNLPPSFNLDKKLSHIYYCSYNIKGIKAIYVYPWIVMLL